MSLVDAQTSKIKLLDGIAKTACQKGSAVITSMHVKPDYKKIYAYFKKLGWVFCTETTMQEFISNTLCCSADDIAFMIIDCQQDCKSCPEHIIDLNKTEFMILGTSERTSCLLIAANKKAIVKLQDELDVEKSAANQHKDNLKYDDDKCRLDLVEPSLIEAVGWIRTFGIKKYPEVYGYKKLEPWRIMGALLRHINAYRSGEKVDAESGYSHLWHAACNLMFLIELERESKNDEDTSMKPSGLEVSDDRED